jgi:septum site-determining protein MinD
MSEVIVVTSGKGGVGKTTTSANVGTGLAMLGEKVVLIDTDIGLRNLDVVMGLENRIVYNLVDVVEGNCRIKQALIKDKRYPNLFLLPSAQTRDKSSVSPGQMRKLTDDLREDFDYVLLDCPAGIEQGFKNAIAGADRAFVVTTPEVSAIRDADRIIGLLEASEIRKADLIVNRLRMDMVRHGDMMSLEDVTDILGIPILGVIPDDEEIVISTNQGEPLVGMNDFAGQAYLNICKRVLGQEVPLMELERGRGFLTRFASLLKRA